MKKKTTEIFKEEVKSLVGKEYVVISEYIDSKTYIDMKHNTCDYTYPVIPSNFLAGSRCPKCSGKMKKTHEQYITEVKELVGNEYIVLSEYINSKTYVDMKHNVCNHIYPVTPNDFLTGYRCPKCAGNITKTQEQFEKEIYDLVGNEYIVIGRYKNTNTKIDLRHNICKHDYPVLPRDFLRGNRCPKCGGRLTRTQEQFKKEVYDLVGDEYIVLGVYTKSHSKIDMKHNTCGHKYPVKPISFLRGNRCPKCAGKLSRTHEDFVKEVYDLVGDEYVILGEYINRKTKVLMLHNKCGHKSPVTPGHFLRGSRCLKCSGKMKKTHEQFVKELYELVGDNYTALEEYITALTKIKIKHNICGHEYSVKPNDVLNGHGCPKCFRNPKKTHEQFIQEIYELVRDEYTVLSKYIGHRAKVELKHNHCGHTYPTTPDNFIISGHRCPKCFGSIKKTHEQFVQEVNDLVKDEYLVLGKYINAHTKIKFRHSVCGHEYDTSPNVFIKGHRCPACNESKGEVSIRNLLTTLNTEFQTQYRFDDCRNQVSLPFDFAVLRNGRLVLLIEFDGEQHYKPIKHFGGKNSFKKLQKNDLIKNTYCKKNNIPLLRIPYWEFDNIEAILTDFLKRHMDISA